MAKRFIPRKTKVRMEFVKGITLPDIIMGAIGLAGVFAFAVSNLPYHLYFALAWGVLSALMFMPIEDGLKLYASLGLLIRFIAFRKKYNKSEVDKKTNRLKIRDIIPFEGIIKDKFLDFKEYYGMVIEVKPIEFGLLNDYKQENVIRSFANALRRLTNEQTASIIKINKIVSLGTLPVVETKLLILAACSFVISEPVSSPSKYPLSDSIWISSLCL